MSLRPTFHHNLFCELKQHRWAYLILLAFFGLVVGLFIFAGYNLMWQRISIIFLGAGYFIWGMITHLSAKHLSARLVFEYAAISILASVCLIALTV